MPIHRQPTHYIIILLGLLMCTLSAKAQQESLSGRIVDSENGEALVKATVQLYKATSGDTAFVAGALTNSQGNFSLAGVKRGDYLLRATYLGYKPLVTIVSVESSTRRSLGNLKMTSDAVVLSEAVVVANLPKMVIRDDTVVYNADAFRVPEGSAIEALVEMLPGAKIDDDGKITINGKEVKKFKMDGRDFMTGNTRTAMQNLPSYVIDQVKAYDEKSDLSRMTGVDDGNDDFVLEFVIKRSARRGLQANPDIGYGTDGRYGLRLTAMKPFGAMRYTFMGNANNVNDRGFSGRGGRGRGNGQGQRETKTGALDASYESERKPNGNQLRTSGRVTWTRSDADNWSRTGSESFVNTRGGAFSNSTSQSYSRNNIWTGNMNLQWTIDTLTTLSFRPNLSISNSDSRSFSSNASFNANPFDYVDDALAESSIEYMDEQGLVVNRRRGKSLSHGQNKNLSTQMQLYRRFGSRGRNIAISGNISYSEGDNRNANLSAVHLYQQQDRLGNDSTYQTNRYTLSGNNNFNYSIGATYT